MYEFKSQDEYNEAKKELLNLFGDEGFAKEYLYKDAMFKAVFEMLLRDASPYEMIKELVIERQRLIDKIKELIVLMPILYKYE